MIGVVDRSLELRLFRMPVTLKPNFKMWRDFRVVLTSILHGPTEGN